MRRWKECLLGAVIVVLLFGWGNTYLDLRDARRTPHIYADTVWVPTVPKELQEEVERLQTENRSLTERLARTRVLRPEEGTGPVVVYEGPVPIDTAIMALSIKKGKLHTLLQIPDSGQAHWVQLPVKDIRGCTTLEMGGNGMTRCQKPPFGVLDAFGSLSTPVSNLEVGGIVGLSWKRNPVSPWQVEVWGRPQEWFSDRPSRVYVGVRGSINLLGM